MAGERLHTHYYLVTHTFCLTERSVAQTWSILVMKMILACFFANIIFVFSLLKAVTMPCVLLLLPDQVDGTSQLLIGRYGQHINGATMESSVAAPSSDCYHWPFSSRVNWAAGASKLKQQLLVYLFLFSSVDVDESLCIRVIVLETGVRETQWDFKNQVSYYMPFFKSIRCLLKKKKVRKKIFPPLVFTLTNMMFSWLGPALKWSQVLVGSNARQPLCLLKWGSWTVRSQGTVQAVTEAGGVSFRGGQRSIPVVGSKMVRQGT